MSKTRVHWRDGVRTRTGHTTYYRPMFARCGAEIKFHRFARTVITTESVRSTLVEAAYTKVTADIFLRWEPKPPRRKCPNCMHVAEMEVLGDWGPLVEMIERAQRREMKK